MEYLILSFALAVISVLMHPHAKGKALSNADTAQNNSQHAICMANISAGTLCSESAQVAQKYVLVRGQPLPL